VSDHRAPVLLLGESGRVGSAVATRLRERVEVVTIGRFTIEDPQPFENELARVLHRVSVVLNVAGVAHLEGDPTESDLVRLVAANVALPLLVARHCVLGATDLVHVSSSKASFTRRSSSAYAWSKRMCDATLVDSLGVRFEDAGRSLSIVRPPAMLFPPFDAGRLRILRRLAPVPSALVPPIPMRVLTAERFLDDLVDLALNADARQCGVRIIEYPSSERADLRVIHEALVSERKQRAGAD